MTSVCVRRRTRPAGITGLEDDVCSFLEEANEHGWIA